MSALGGKVICVRRARCAGREAGPSIHHTPPHPAISPGQEVRDHRDRKKKDEITLHHFWGRPVRSAEWSRWRPGAVKGGTLLDVGTAPSIYQLLSSCEAFDEVIVTWFTQSELRQLQKWQNKEPDAFDWSSIVKHVCELEGNKVSAADKEEKLRGKIKKSWYCDLGKSKPLEPVQAPKVDCITATVCLEAACKNFEAYGLALRRLGDLLKPNGHLLLAGDLGANYYEVGAEKVFSLPVSEKSLKETLTAGGYRIIELATFGKPDDADPNLSDYEGFYFAHAQKA